MYVISFRIPYRIFNRVCYINGSALSKKQYNKGDCILVEEINGPTSLSVAPAEVIDSRFTSRNDFPFKIV